MAKRRPLDPDQPSDVQPGEITDAAAYADALSAGEIAEVPAAGPLEEPLTSIEYIGPAGQQSPVLGPLSVGARYQVNVTFADYLVERHPDFWARADA